MNVITEACIEWIRMWFRDNGGKTAVVGISGGKDSTVTAKLCCEALGKVELSPGEGNMIIPTAQTRINLAPRLRMATLYAIAQSENGGRVACTGNLDEALMGYFTLWGDGAGDFAPLAMMHVSQVIATGLDLGLPEDLVRKTPSDGLTGKSDEEALGFPYALVEDVYENGYDALHEDERRKQVWVRMTNMAWKGKLARIPHYTPLSAYGKAMPMCVVRGLE